MLEVRGARSDEVDAAIECAGRAFGRDDPERVRGMTDFFSRIHKHDPYFRPENSRIAVVDGVVASVVQVFDREILVQGVPVPLGGIGSVGTDPAYQRQGLSNKVLEDAAQYMTRRGLVLSSLGTGIHDHYGKVGWQRFEHHAYLEVGVPAALPEAPEGVTIRQTEWASDGDVVARIHEQFSRGVSGAIHRPKELWEAAPRWRGIDPSRRHVAEVGGNVVAYRQDGGHDGDRIDEIGHAEGHVGAAHALILGFLAAKARGGATSVRIDTTTFGPWVEGLGAEITTGHYGGGMYRINDLALLMELLSPAMSCRLAASDDAGWAGCISLQTEIGDVSVAVERSGVTIRRGEPDRQSDARLVLTHKQAIELILGQVAPATFAEGSAPSALDALFPKTEYRWHSYDGF